MIAYLTELHDEVHQVLHLLLVLLKLEQVLCRDVILNALVKDALSESHIASQLYFCLWSDFLLDISLETTKHKWFQDGVKTF